MRHTSVLLLVCLSGLSAAGAQQQGQLYTASREQLDVTKVVLAQEKTWNAADLDGYLALYKDGADTEAILNGPVRGLTNIRSAYHASFPNKDAMGTLEQSEVEVRELGPNFALARGHYRLLRARKNGGDAEGNFTEIFEKTEAGWKMIFSENT
ncbi:MAG TPA: SgcJ/EcaC family oxidoreductase [Acidobacteriaceae bacterium]|nr:SgcJ/EcaC family oxidoreductase [Acidobacteriaceae bacterium]